MSVKILFTVFTPTYNRKELLHRVYNSLQNQTFSGFEWLVIDDGSTDGTEDLIKFWQKKSPFSIIYHKQPNQGKHVAYNTAAKFAKGELFTAIDSDDEIIPTTLERLKFHWDNFTIQEKSYVAGISFNSNDQFGNLVGTKFPKDYEVMDLMGMYYLNNVKGDKGGVVQTKVLYQYPFPENIKNVYVPESSFMFKVAKDWKMCFINESLRIYWLEKRQDSLSILSTKAINYKGSLYAHECFLNYNMRFFLKKPKLCIGEAIRYSKLSFHLNVNLKNQFGQITPISAKILWVCIMPLSFIFFQMDKLKATRIKKQ